MLHLAVESKLRNIYDVAGSWNKRAFDPRDVWPIGNDYCVAVERWNEAVGATDAAIQRGVDIADVRYEQMFEGNESTRARARKVLFERLGVKDAKESEPFHEYCFAALGKIRTRRLKLESFQVDYLKYNADFGLLNRLLISAKKE